MSSSREINDCESSSLRHLQDTLLDLEPLPSLSRLLPAAPYPFANANGACFSPHSIGGGCKPPPLPRSILFHPCPCGASPCGAPRPALRGPSGAPRGPARAAQGAVEAGAQPLAPPASPSLASLALGAARPESPVCLATRDGGGVSTRAGPCGPGSAARGPRPLGVWAVLMSALPLPEGRGWG